VAADWVFRHAGGCLIEVPPLQLPPLLDRCYSTSWVATWWRDASSPTGWRWWRRDQAERGWELPRHLAIGDVLEFGLAMVSTADGTVVAGCDLGWYGWLRYSTDLALVGDGPYPDPASTGDPSTVPLAELRLTQLPSLAIDPDWVPDDIATEP